MTRYKPLSYGSKEYNELRRTVVTRRARIRIAGRPAVLEHQHAARPGLWTKNTADIYTVLTGDGPGVGGLSGSSVTVTVVAWDVTRELAIAAAKERLTPAGTEARRA